jgi:hypothetical protein
MLGIPSKKGTIPLIRLSEGTMKFVPSVDGREPIIELRSTTTRRLTTIPVPLQDGGVEFTFRGTGGKRFTPRYAADLSRALLKMGLECAWLDHGEVVFEDRFDALRSLILGERFTGLFALYKNANWSEVGSDLTYQFFPINDSLTQMWVGLRHAGVYMLASSGSNAKEQIPRESWSVLTFDA